MTIQRSFPWASDPFRTGVHSGLNFAYGDGRVRQGAASVDVASGTLALTDDTTNYVEVTPAGTISDNTSGFTAGSIPLYTVVTASGAITSVTDERAFLGADAFTAADRTKLDGIEALADVTDATNVDAAGATMNTDTDVSSNSWVLDEDDFASDSATKVPTQQSVKAYGDQAYAALDDTLFIAAGLLEISNNTPSYTALTNKTGVWLLAALNEGISATLRVGSQGLVIPKHWSTFKYSVVWANTGTNSGNVVLRGDHVAVGIAAASDLNASRTVESSVTVAASTTAHESKVTELATGITVATVGDLHTLQALRVNDAADTMPDDIEVAGLLLEKVT